MGEKEFLLAYLFHIKEVGGKTPASFFIGKYRITIDLRVWMYNKIIRKVIVSKGGAP